MKASASSPRGRITRRALVGGAVGIAGAAHAQAPAVRRAGPRPVVIASANGNRWKNGGARTCVAEAFERMHKGADVLDALVAGVEILERDPADDSVGYGGLPNADGVVQLDAACMHGPRRRAGGVAALEGVRTPARVAQLVADTTDHHLLVGAGAQVFARQMGFAIEADLNTAHSRKLWLDWKRRIDPQHYLDPARQGGAAERARRQMIAAGLLDPNRIYGTVNCNGVDAKGAIAGVTSTSGLAWKIPGRAGDSPILGAGLWVDGEVGAAGSTGRGEANLYNLSSFFIVEQMRRGAHPKDAGMEALRRIKDGTREARLLTKAGLPSFNVHFYVLDRQGRAAGVALYAVSRGKPSQFAICTDNGPETRASEALLPELPIEVK